jgi:hypothetical protein
LNISAVGTIIKKALLEKKQGLGLRAKKEGGLEKGEFFFRSVGFVFMLSHLSFSI